MGSFNLPGRTKPEPLAENGLPLRGGIAEKVFADINGVRQGMFIEGGPVLEEPQKARGIMREDVLAGANSLADGSPGAGQR